MTSIDGLINKIISPLVDYPKDIEISHNESESFYGISFTFERR